MWAVVYTAPLLLIQINDTKLIKKKCLVNWPNSKFLQENQMRDDRIRIPLKYLDEQRVLANLCHHQSDRLSLYFFSLLQRCSVESVLHSLLDTVHVRVSKWVCKEEFRKNHFATLFLKRDLPSGSGRQFCVIKKGPKKGPKKSPKRIFEKVICLNSSKSQIF